MAAPILSYEDLGLIQGEGWLFRELDLYIGERDRLALIGRNGAGKTTLLKCLAGLIETDEGKRTIVPGTNVVLLEQDPGMTGFETLEQWVVHGPDAPEPHEATAIAHQLGIDLSRPTATASAVRGIETNSSRRVPRAYPPLIRPVRRAPDIVAKAGASTIPTASGGFMRAVTAANAIET